MILSFLKNIVLPIFDMTCSIGTRWTIASYDDDNADDDFELVAKFSVSFYTVAQYNDMKQVI